MEKEQNQNPEEINIKDPVSEEAVQNSESDDNINKEKQPNFLVR